MAKQQPKQPQQNPNPTSPDTDRLERRLADQDRKIAAIGQALDDLPARLAAMMGAGGKAIAPEVAADAAASAPLEEPAPQGPEPIEGNWRPKLCPVCEVGTFMRTGQEPGGPRLYECSNAECGQPFRELAPERVNAVQDTRPPGSKRSSSEGSAGAPGR